MDFQLDFKSLIIWHLCTLLCAPRIYLVGAAGRGGGGVWVLPYSHRE